MPIVPEDWLTLAKNLANAPTPTEADLRRAVSTAYYAVFHLVLKTATEQLLGSVTDTAYVALYRRVEHRRMIEMCTSIADVSLTPRMVERLGFATPPDDLRDFATWLRGLYQGRRRADYDPATTLDQRESHALVQSAEDAMQAFNRVPSQQRNAFLLYMLFGDK